MVEKFLHEQNVITWTQRRPNILTWTKILPEDKELYPDKKSFPEHRGHYLDKKVLELV